MPTSHFFSRYSRMYANFYFPHICMPFYFAIDIRHRTMNERVPLLLTFSYILFSFYTYSFFTRTFLANARLGQQQHQLLFRKRKRKKKAFYLSAEFVKTERVWESSLKEPAIPAPTHTTSAASKLPSL